VTTQLGQRAYIDVYGDLEHVRELNGYRLSQASIWPCDKATGKYLEPQAVGNAEVKRALKTFLPLVAETNQTVTTFQVVGKRITGANPGREAVVTVRRAWPVMEMGAGSATLHFEHWGALAGTGRRLDMRLTVWVHPWVRMLIDEGIFRVTYTVQVYLDQDDPMAMANPSTLLGTYTDRKTVEPTSRVTITVPVLPPPQTTVRKGTYRAVITHLAVESVGKSLGFRIPPLTPYPETMTMVRRHTTAQ
jgi:hypothetical protein